MNVTEIYNHFNKWKGLLQASLTVFYRVWLTQLGVQMRVYVTVKFQILTNLRAQPSVFSYTHIGGSELAIFSPGEFSCTAAIEKQNIIK